ncbi:MAG TPA: fumarylacetoacetate hydrolase family protein [Candidatus Dormibacteraeota bacterium]|nr:fumarylacetoacetate hydrolase family protein [Candidatus Dormibacteraeota bacterium]
MKLVTYSESRKQSKNRPGLLWGDRILELRDISSLANKLDIKIPKRTAALTDVVSLLELLERGGKVLDDLQSLSWRIFNRLGSAVPRTLKTLADVTLHSPIQRPPVLRDFYAFEEHVKAARARRGLQIPQEWYDFPAFYYSNPGKVYGPDEDIPRPNYTKALDYELEIACVLGKSGKNLSQEEAESYIAGYTIMNDWSARDVQDKEMKIGLGPAKAKDFATSLGPWIVTPDELQDKRTTGARFDLAMKARVNSKQLSNGNMKKMYWSFPQMISRASQSVEIHPGEIFGSGTVGTGSILELGQDVHRWLSPGDVVELEIERLGTLRNRIIETSN